MLARLLLTVAISLGAVLPAAADTRFYAYEASGRAARYRTGDVTLEVRTPMFLGSTRLRSVWRRRGSDLPLSGPTDAFRRQAVQTVIGQSADGVAVYAVDTEAGRGFAQGACEGAPRAWVAAAEPRPYQPLRLWVLRQGASGAPELCETLDYTWRAEWQAPPNRQALETPGTPVPYR